MTSIGTSFISTVSDDIDDINTIGNIGELDATGYDNVYDTGGNRMR